MIETDDIPIYLLRIFTIILVFSLSSIFSVTKSQIMVAQYHSEQNRLALAESDNAKYSNAGGFFFVSVANAVEIDKKYITKTFGKVATKEVEEDVVEKPVVKKAKLTGENGTYRITGYNAVPAQTDDSPTIAAWNDNIENAVNVAAVTQDSPWKRGTCLTISGLPEKYLVLDRFNKRYNGQKKVDILVGTKAEAKAITGKRTVTVSPPGSCDLKRVVDGKVTYEKLQKKRF